MNANQEKLLVATLVGLIIAAAAAFAVQPALATSLGGKAHAPHVFVLEL